MKLPLTLFAAFTIALQAAAPLHEMRKDAEKLLKEEKYDSARLLLERVAESAAAEKAWTEAARAHAEAILLEMAIKMDEPTLAITRMDALLAKAPAELQPMLLAVQASWWHDYFESHCWELMRRTATAADSAGDDIAAWDLERLLREVDARFQKALANAAELKRTPIAQWNGLLSQGGIPDSYQPTLYDFLARQALKHYTSAAQAAAEVKAENAFGFDAKSPALGSREQFLAWKPDAKGPKARVIQLYQSLLAIHKDDADAGARVLLDAARLSWAAAAAEGPGADELRFAALMALAKEHAAHEVTLSLRATLAERLVSQKKSVEAHAMLTEALAAHGKSPFAPACRNLIRKIEQKELSASTEMIWNSAGPEIIVTARNVEQVFFKLIPVSKEPDPVMVGRTMEDKKKIARLLRKPGTGWALTLEAPKDYEEHTHRFPAPTEAKPGLYLLTVSGDANFSQKKNQISFAPVIVSPLSVVARKSERGESEIAQAWILDALSGDPVEGAEVEIWEQERYYQDPTRVAKLVSDVNGQISYESKTKPAVWIVAKRGDSTAISNIRDGYSHELDEPTDGTSTFFFTDRAIYRPGQTIQFKGIHVKHGEVKNDYRTLAKVKRYVVLRDANDRELAAMDVVTNAFGSFSGTFTAPQTGVTGRLTLTDGETGRTVVSVEEYKRPKFSVEVLPPAEPGKLGAAVTVKVKAMTYTGSPVDGAKVTWRVQREAEWAPWVRGSWWWHGNSNEQQIAHGEAVTAADGTAEVKFTAERDKSVAEKGDPWFHYSIHADVTDTAGETRSADGSVRVGFTAMKAEVTAEEWQTVKQPVTFTVNTTTLDGEPLKAAGVVKVHRLKEPQQVQRPRMEDDDYTRAVTGTVGEVPAETAARDLSDPANWDTGELVQRSDVATTEKGESTVKVKLASGAYRAVFESLDRFGKKVTAEHTLLVVDPAAEKFPVKVPFVVVAPSWELQPGDDLSALWGSGYDRARAFIEIEHRGKIVQKFWTDAARTQQSVPFKVTEAHRGGFSVHVHQMRENRLISESFPVSVKWRNKDLTLKWEHLTSKLQPGTKDSWTLSISGSGKEKAAAEMVAVLYDASLDALKEHVWGAGFDVFYSESTDASASYFNEMMEFEEAVDEWHPDYELQPGGDRAWFWEGGRGSGRGAGFVALPMAMASKRGAPKGMKTAITRGLRFGSDEMSRDAIDAAVAGGVDYTAAPAASFAADPFASADAEPAIAPEKAPERAIAARKNLQETAFFFPHLLSAEDGTVKLEFTMPEAVTAWRFMGFAHDRQLRSGYLEGATVTAKDLMVQPNPPRFLREGDVVEFTVKITNQSDAAQQGTARLAFTDAATLASADAALGLAAPEQVFEVPAKESRTVAWRITVPDGQGFLSYKATAGTTTLSDGEEGWLPVLPRLVLVTESLPVTMTKAGERTFTFDKLAASAASPTLRHQGLTVQMVSQPAWYAVMALPYLMEFPHECSEQTFHRFYANALAQHLAGSDPQIRRTFDLWRDAQPAALESPLLKNTELKSLLIEETPWLREAAKESEQRSSVGLLFDANRLDSETARVLAKLDGLQLDDGSWPWFAGGRGNEYITLTIVSGFGRLLHMGVPVKADMALEALDYLDEWLGGEHKAALKSDKARKDGKTGDHFSSSLALYLYARSFFLEQRPVPEEQKAALDYFLTQARANWPGKERLSQAHAALGLLRFGEKAAAVKIVESLKERSVYKEDLGRYWPESANAWHWSGAPVESQALMMEALREITQDSAAADECALWLLRQKQTQAWPSTIATADACYALLLGGTKKLSTGATLSVSLGGAEVKPENVEAGTGFYEKRFTAAEVKPEMSAVKLSKPDKGPAWGSVHWQYLEDMDKVTPHAGTPLKVTKSLFTKVNTEKGPELRPVEGKVKVGDELVVRLTLSTDRDMEFVHLKDQRPSSVEPVNVLSEYKWQDGLGYYESTRDTASHFFFDALPKGTFVIEYSARVQLRGACQTGLATLQCLYAPEFRSHSAGAMLEVE